MKTFSRSDWILLIASIILFVFMVRTSIDRPLARKYEVFSSVAAQDGWILETEEDSNTGGSLNATGSTLAVGDGSGDRQYRTILSFNTAGIPQTAKIADVRLRLKLSGVAGSDPFTTHGNLVFDMRKPFFGNGAGLAAGDFQAPAGKMRAGQFNPVPVEDGWVYEASLPATSFELINRGGTTQFRLRFPIDDNDDSEADLALFFSGDSTVELNRPQLVVGYNP